MIIALQSQRTGPLIINSAPFQLKIGGCDSVFDSVFAAAYLIKLLQKFRIQANHGLCKNILVCEGIC